MSSQNSNIRWIDLSEDQKKQVLRMRNAESARKSRQKKRTEEDRIDKLHDSNENRLHSLERVVDELMVDASRRSSRKSEHASKSSKGSSASSAATRASSSSSSAGSSKSHGRGGNGKHPDGRPEWFGDAF